MTVCTKCLVDKADFEFAPNRHKRNGLQSHCRKCAGAVTAQWHAKNPDKVRKNRKKWVDSDPERAARVRDAWEAANADKLAVYSKKWESSNPEKARQARSKWWAGNSDRTVTYRSLRRAALLNSVPVWELDPRSSEQAWRQANPGMALDHIVPVTPPLARTLGGRPMSWQAGRKFIGPLVPIVYGFHTQANWQPLSKSENSRKSNRDWPDAPWN